jgi:benzoyl-CoA reductase subunit D
MMTITAGIDVGSGAVKSVILRCAEAGRGGGEDRERGGDNRRGGDGSGRGEEHDILAHVSSRIRRREVAAVVEEVFAQAVRESGVKEIHYVASTGDGEDIPFATGHFYGMTTHARGALHLEPRARAVLDVGALHARAVAMDDRGRVLNYRMTSQCASGSGQFLENIARYLGVSHDEIGELSLQAQHPEKVSSICAVLPDRRHQHGIARHHPPTFARRETWLSASLLRSPRSTVRSS